MSSSMLDLLPSEHIVTAVVAANGETMTTNDGSATIATNGTGIFTITFGQPFRSTPVVSVDTVLATFATTSAVGANITTVATDSVKITSWSAALVGATETDIANAATDIICHVRVIGSRDR